MSDAHQRSPIQPADPAASSPFAAGGDASAPWPPPGTQPPTPMPTPTPIAAPPEGAAPPAPHTTTPAPVDPTHADVGGGPPGDGIDDDLGDDDDSRAPIWALALIPVVIIGLLVFLLWRANQDDEASPTPSSAVTTAPETGTSGDGTTSAAGTTGAATTTPGGATTTPGGAGATATTAPAASATTAATTAPGATTPGATTPGATTPGGSTPAVTNVSPTTTPGPTTPTQRALAVAQDMAAVLADGDWAAARRLSPTDQRTDAEFERDYAGLEASTVVPARETTLSSGLVDLRVGLVAYESRSGGPQTSLFCAHWIVDPLDDTVQRLSAQRVRTEGGTVPVSQVASELGATCATMPLR